MYQHAVSFAYAGVAGNAAASPDSLHDMQEKVYYAVVYNNFVSDSQGANLTATFGDSLKKEYQDIITSEVFSNASPVVLEYYADNQTLPYYDVSSPATGVYPLTHGEAYPGIAIYRREHGVYSQASSGSVVEVNGPWEPVSFGEAGTHIRDMNIKNDHSYQYIAYPQDSQLVYQFANDPGQTKKPSPIAVGWGCWTMTELTKQTNPLGQSPTVKDVYAADLQNVWVFAYGVSTGSESQNISRNEVQTLGAYPRMSQGLLNCASGSISCYLGSEVIPYDGLGGYIERMRAAEASPLSTNEGALMLRRWKQFAYSKNPKLLKDMKGQSWIVQILSPSSTVSDYIYGHPTQISFSWKQIGSTDGAVIYANGDPVAGTPGACGSRWMR